jgi:molecular chaperone GrpE
MNPKQEIENFEEHDNGPLSQRSGSVDDFIRELEEKEKDLHITADLAIEIEDVDFDDANIPDFIAEELAIATPQSQKEMAVKPAPAIEQRFKNEITSLKTHIEELKKERTQILEKSQARLKEFENFKKRLERERRETFVDQVCNLAKLMLPVIDNMDRALVAARDLPGEKSQEFSHFFDGIVLVNQQIIDILERMGVKPVASVGEEFDPHLHEAVEMISSDMHPQNTIVDELLRGYSVGDKIIRHSMVKVVSGSTIGETNKQGIEHTAELDVEDLENHPDRLSETDDEVAELISSSYEGGSDPSTSN